MRFCHRSAKFSSPGLLPIDLLLKCKHFPSVPEASFISHELVRNSTPSTEIQFRHRCEMRLPTLHLMAKYGHDSTAISTQTRNENSFQFRPMLLPVGPADPSFVSGTTLKVHSIDCCSVDRTFPSCRFGFLVFPIDATGYSLRCESALNSRR